jgi:peptidoglycan/LPS O-acetylase OafA/YrhL
MTASQRYHDLDAVRAFALVLGVVFHACLSFVPVPIGWAVMDVSTSPLILSFVLVSHSFRMPLFFMIAGFFGRMAFHRKGGGAFLKGRVLRLVIPFMVGWWILWPLVISGWIMGGAAMRGELEVGKALMGGLAAFGQLPEGLFVQTHLWFLHYLLLITLLMLVLRSLSGFVEPLRRGLGCLGDRLAVGLARPLGVLMLVLPTALALWFMRGWGMDTPDKSLVPQFPVLFVYWGAFQLGWILNRNPDVLNRWTRPGWVRLGLLAAGVGCSLWFARFQADPSHPDIGLMRMGFVAGYALMMWSLVFFTIGIFRRWMNRSRAWIRYLADASYWIYLLHLPVVVWLQVLVAEWSLPWLPKMGFVILVTIGVSLLTYDLFVRATPVGQLLNGHRRARVLRWTIIRDRTAALPLFWKTP